MKIITTFLTCQRASGTWHRLIIFIILFFANSTLIFAQKDINYQLIVAANNNNEKKVFELLREGADPNATPYGNITPLMYASENGNEFICIKLLEYGAEIDKTATNGPPALISATLHKHPKIVELLANNNANLDIIDNKGNTPLIYASAEGYWQIADILLYFGASPNIKANNNNSPLIIASYYGDTLMCNLLIKYKADINIKDNGNYTPLMVAAQNNYIEVVKLLIENKAHINEVNENNFSALDIAIYNNNNEIVEYLLAYGANPNKNTQNKTSPYELCIITNNNIAKKSLRKYKANKGYAPLFNKIPIGFTNNFNNKDYMLGMELGVQEGRYKVDFYVGIITRPYRKQVWLKESENLYYQLLEKRSMAYIQLDKRFDLFKIDNNIFGITFGVKGIYTFGNYSASLKNIDKNILYTPQLGLFIRNKNISIKTSYEYVNLGGIKNSPHRVNISLYFLIPTITYKFKNKYIYWW